MSLSHCVIGHVWGHNQCIYSKGYNLKKSGENGLFVNQEMNLCN